MYMAEKNKTNQTKSKTILSKFHWIIITFVSWVCIPNFSFLSYNPPKIAIRLRNAKPTKPNQKPHQIKNQTNQYVQNENWLENKIILKNKLLLDS